MNANTLIKQFEFCRSTMGKTLENFTDEDSLFQPAGAGNCANWIAGHIIATRNGLHKVLGIDPAWPAAESERYKRGTAPITGDAGARPLASILDLYSASQVILLEALDGLTDEGLTKNVDGQTLAEVVAGFAFHESYHVGQLGLLRRMVGKEGVVK